MLPDIEFHTAMTLEDQEHVALCVTTLGGSAKFSETANGTTILLRGPEKGQISVCFNVSNPLRTAHQTAFECMDRWADEIADIDDQEELTA